MTLALTNVTPSVLAVEAEATPPETKTVTCPTFQGVVTSGERYGGGPICGWFVFLKGYNGYKFDLNKEDKITFDYVANDVYDGAGRCYYKFYDNGKYLGDGAATPSCMSCKIIPRSNKLACVE